MIPTTLALYGDLSQRPASARGVRVSELRLALLNTDGAQTRRNRITIIQYGLETTQLAGKVFRCLASSLAKL